MLTAICILLLKPNQAIVGANSYPAPTLCGRVLPQRRVEFPSKSKALFAVVGCMSCQLKAGPCLGPCFTCIDLTLVPQLRVHLQCSLHWAALYGRDKCKENLGRTAGLLGSLFRHIVWKLTTCHPTFLIPFLN